MIFLVTDDEEQGFDNQVQGEKRGITWLQGVVALDGSPYSCRSNAHVECQ